MKTSKKGGENIETTLDLDTISLKKGRWEAKILAGTTLPKSYRAYKLKLQLDQEPYLRRIKEVEEEFKKQLFSQMKDGKAEHKEKVAKMKQDLDDLIVKCEDIEFGTVVKELKYKEVGTLLNITIPDDIIEPINRQKTNLHLYKLTLSPIKVKI